MAVAQKGKMPSPEEFDPLDHAVVLETATPGTYKERLIENIKNEIDQITMYINDTSENKKPFTYTQVKLYHNDPKKALKLDFKVLTVRLFQKATVITPDTLKQTTGTKIEEKVLSILKSALNKIANTSKYENELKSATEKFNIILTSIQSEESKTKRKVSREANKSNPEHQEKLAKLRSKRIAKRSAT